MDHNIKVFAGRASRDLAERIAQSFGTTLGKSSVLPYSDGEFQPSFDETVRGNYVFIVQSTFMPTENLFELLLMIDAAKRASAYKVIAVMPYFGFARQDRKDKPRVSIGAKLVANLLSAAGVDRVITMDLHADQIQGFFDVPVDHLYASAIFIPYIKQLQLENLVMASPDTGGSKRANAYAKYLGTELVISHKFRKRANQIEKMRIIGDVVGKNVILIDDMIDTAGTITKAADMMMDGGALSVRALASHAVLSGPAIERIENSSITELITTDSIPQLHGCTKIRTLSVAELFSNVITNVYSYRSISSNFII